MAVEDEAALFRLLLEDWMRSPCEWVGWFRPLATSHALKTDLYVLKEDSGGG